MHLTGSRGWLYAAAFLMPAVLLFSSIRTFREFQAQREVYLRERAATIAGRLEAANARNQPTGDAILSLLEEEPHLRELKIAARAEGMQNPAIEDVWSGRALFYTAFVESGGNKIYRAYVPFHADGVMNVAQIDVDLAASDFLVEHARHNVMISIAGGIALVLISLYSIWAARRSALLERRQLEMEHMAHLGRMSAVLAHEIRNPLGTIKGFTQLAIERSGEGLSALLSPVIEQTKRLESLVNDLLVYGRPPSPAMRRVEWVEFVPRIEAAARQVALDHDVVLDIGDGDLHFTTDPNLLEQVLINLIRNGAEAAGTRRIEVRAVRSGGFVEIAVRDDGPGIAEAQREQVLQPFFTTKAFGTGLGLPISQRLTEALGGSFSIGPAESGGTVAALRVPVEA
jgi:two-component system, NtrC family, sensor histidine kinase HydH